MGVILRHMVPNVVAPFLIMITAFVGQAILAEASLSYLGLGVQEPVPAWGLMLQGGAEEYASSAPWIAIFPDTIENTVGAGYNFHSYWGISRLRFEVFTLGSLVVIAVIGVIGYVLGAPVRAATVETPLAPQVEEAGLEGTARA